MSEKMVRGQSGVLGPLLSASSARYMYMYYKHNDATIRNIVIISCTYIHVDTVGS